MALTSTQSQEVYNAATSRGATPDQARLIAEAVGRGDASPVRVTMIGGEAYYVDEHGAQGSGAPGGIDESIQAGYDAFMAGSHRGVLYGVVSRPEAVEVSFPDPADGGVERQSSGSLEQEFSSIIARLAEQDEQNRIDAANRLALEARQFEQRLEFDERKWAEQLELEETLAALQGVQVERGLLEPMSTPFSSLMGQFQLRAPDEPVTLTPGVGAVLRGAGIPVAGEIEGQPVTVSARDLTAGGGQVVRDLMRNIGAREWEGISADPMEMAQLEVLGAVGGIGRLPLVQGIRNRQVNERPLFSSRFVS